MFQHHPFHIVYYSPWPFLVGLIVIRSFFVFLLFLNKMSFIYFIYFFFLLSVCLYNWWRDVNRERSLQGYHTTYVFSNMRYGILLFIVSEILFFISFFWSFFHSRLSPNYELGSLWPPTFSYAINPFDVPLLNTVILLRSGVTVTLSHHYIINKNNYMSYNYLLITIILGLYFTLAQVFEYLERDFLICDSVFGSTFFMATGFHGFHVIVGSLLLFFALIRLRNNYMNYFHHVGLERSIWYWHFVDVVWLYLFIFVYWWVY